MNKQNNSGFTLIELVVVIAILGILSGIGVAGYSGYIQKANEAADKVLLGAVNSAFQVACAEADPVAGYPRVASAVLMSDGSVDKVTSALDPDGGIFDRYYSDNNQPFKYYSRLKYAGDGSFYGLSGGETSEDAGDGWTKTTYNGPNGQVSSYSKGTQTIDVVEKDKTAVDNSTFGDKEVITMENMMNEIGGVTTLASGMLGASGGLAQALNTFAADPGFKGFVSSLGVDADTIDDTEMMNAMVMYAATNTDLVDTDAMLTALKAAGSNPANVLAAAGASGNDMAAGLSSAAMIYGLATSYAYKNNLVKDNAINTMVAVIKDDGWNAYLESDQATKDIEGYSGAMNMISDNIGNLNSKDLLSQGFASEDIIGMLNMVFEQ